MSTQPTAQAPVTWCRLGDLVADISDGVRGGLGSANQVPFLRLSDLQPLDASAPPSPTQDAAAPLNLKSLREGDIVLAKTGGEPKAAVVQPEAEQSLFAADVYRVRLLESCGLSAAWLACYLNTQSGIAAFRERAQGTHVRRICADDLHGFPVPVPAKELQQQVECLVTESMRLNATAATEFAAVRKALDAEVERRCPPSGGDRHRFFEARRTDLEERWDVSYQRTCRFTASLAGNPLFRPLRDLASFPSTSRKSVLQDREIAYVQTAEIDPRYLTFSGIRMCLGRDLPARVRVMLSPYQVLVLVSGHAVGTPEHPVAVVEPELAGCMASNAFIALEFAETPLYYGLALKHPVVLQQFQGLASGGTIPFLTRKSIEQALVPVLGEVWRHDFNGRAMMAWERRRRALNRRDEAIRLVEECVGT